jgi:hypothetical protein
VPRGLTHGGAFRGAHRVLESTAAIVGTVEALL